MATVEKPSQQSASQEHGALDRLGYQLKHAQLRFDAFRDEGLAPLGITGRQCAVLAIIEAGRSLSQQDIAETLRVDRTTMVAVIDSLEQMELVARVPQPTDRRKNVITLTDLGRDTFRQSETVRLHAERRFFQRVSAADRETFQRVLRALG